MKNILNKIKRQLGKILRRLPFIRSHEKDNSKRFLLIFVTILAFGLGLIGSVFVYNYLQSKIDNNLEITFVDPRQAVIFWTTPEPTVGFVRYGDSQFSKENLVKQTSSVPGEVHAVVLNDLPLEGVYVSLHTENDSPFLFSKSFKVQFDPSKME